MTLWELFSKGFVPYGTENGAPQVATFVKSGHRLDCPSGCPESMWNIMSSCWLEDQQKRPTFDQIVKQIKV